MSNNLSDNEILKIFQKTEIFHGSLNSNSILFKLTYKNDFFMPKNDIGLSAFVKNFSRSSNTVSMFLDTIGTIHVFWDCGSSLGVVYGEDSCRRIDG